MYNIKRIALSVIITPFWQRRCVLIMKYFVYIVRCKDDTLYTGITTDVDRRVREHNGNNKGAKYTKMRQPVKLVYSTKYANRSQATKAEMQIKELNRKQKNLLIDEKKKV